MHSLQSKICQSVVQRIQNPSYYYISQLFWEELQYSSGIISLPISIVVCHIIWLHCSADSGLISSVQKRTPPPSPPCSSCINNFLITARLNSSNILKKNKKTFKVQDLHVYVWSDCCRTDLTKLRNMLEDLKEVGEFLYFSDHQQISCEEPNQLWTHPT